MSASTFFPQEVPVESCKLSSKPYSLQLSAQQQQPANRHLPAILPIMNMGQLPQIKAEEASQALNYFNNPYPLYCQASNKGEGDLSELLQSSSNSSSSANQPSMNYYSATVSPQTPYSNALVASAPGPLQQTPRKERKYQKYSERCTCKRDENHIPRPRNAFILFRQKHHQSVLKESTKLKTNPDVSRELARRWKALTKDERSHWDSLADEEKRNHAIKYPNYRYKPRRHKNSKLCEICLVKPMSTNTPPVQTFAMTQDFSQVSSNQASKLVRLPAIPLNHYQLHNQEQQPTQLFHQQMNGQFQLPQQYPQLIPQSEAMYISHRYQQYGNCPQQSQYEFGDEISSHNHAFQQQHQQSASTQPQTQHQMQQPYMTQIQRRNSLTQHQILQHSPQHHPQADNYATIAPLQHLDQHPPQAPLGGTTHGVIGAQINGYPDKYCETSDSFSFPDQAGQGQKYTGLPNPIGAPMYAAHDPFTAPTLLQLY
ncbi:hypothetical protein METBIDRAFT_31734 [Metschnikowia bicuspidata var. bicuspidata NRRL YB-4993]|uniref:HMG box domain-containing protein n=1 Tax=Metschnikowia bicuspidata var. bicuspidata NRRL YB-4993 TaxID=869754 RepID=A0A1A0HAU0_9ASCO|nr:hypothetical protein METBIDRAFT_31734 [Metschnikowia bicuspidata var. bicuspidata NRRL YB-4993]OBA21131.1 hypothetical protein METBIDRAFT_31734 [Metschnikowia bicuspidata var. bicuspidata NRRL YB-4993]